MSTISSGTTLTTALVQTGDTTGDLVIKTGSSNTTAMTISGTDQGVTFAGGISLGALTTSGNLTFTGTGNRITGEMSTLTLANRLAFQTNVANGNTNVNLIPNGTAVACSLNLFGSSDVDNAPRGQVILNSTGLQLSSNQTGTGTNLPMLFNTGGSERLRIDTSGSVGIGTNSPTQLLDVRGNISTTNALLFGGNISIPTADASVYRVADNTLAFGTASTERMRINASGNVGIGTSSPTYKLDVGTTSDATNAVNIRTSATGTSLLFFSDTDNGPGGIRYDHTSNFMRFDTNDAERMRITSAGDVGIGTDSPGFASGSGLEVQRAGDATVRVERTGATNSAAEFVAGSGLVKIGATSGSPFAFITDNTERMRITSNGGVSFGSSGTAFGSSGQLLQSNGDAAPTWVTVSTSPVVSAYAVGAYATMQISGGSRSAGTQIAGSSCNAISHISNQSNAFAPNWYQQGTQSGTWQCMASTTGGNSFSIVLMQRIS